MKSMCPGWHQQIEYGRLVHREGPQIPHLISPNWSDCSVEQPWQMQEQSCAGALVQNLLQNIPET
jgi:hypothetical protein